MEEKTTFENIVPKMKALKNQIEGLMKEIELETTSGKKKRRYIVECLNYRQD